MTDDQRHRNYITNGQRVSRHLLPTVWFLSFFHPHFLKTILFQPESGTFGYSPTHKAYSSQSQKSHFFAHAEKHIMKLVNKMQKLNVQYIAPFVSINTTFETLNNLKAGATL